ncbi:hypothetical protein DEJ45_30460 [Streptomyces venezuelae]|uniref:hypothetical protein n=1 Tax=Streptomyces venezuelae TaxID=54571 RepID=UPI0012A9A52F|nr:hypothetical protein [Streptomyces venezuelae]QES16279.1 hypothetical protein DEJ45_30460 [Streptomyces venezuelae]
MTIVPPAPPTPATLLVDNATTDPEPTPRPEPETQPAPEPMPAPEPQPGAELPREPEPGPPGAQERDDREAGTRRGAAAAGTGPRLSPVRVDPPGGPSADREDGGGREPGPGAPPRLGVVAVPGPSRAAAARRRGLPSVRAVRLDTEPPTRPAGVPAGGPADHPEAPAATAAVTPVPLPLPRPAAPAVPTPPPPPTESRTEEPQP